MCRQLPRGSSAAFGAKKKRFHTCGGPRRRPCLGEGRGRRTFLVAVCCSIHPIIIHSILSIMLSLALYHRFQLSILSESSFAPPRLRVQHMAGSEEAFSMFVDGRVYWIHHLHCSLWISYSYVIAHLHCLHPCV